MTHTYLLSLSLVIALLFSSMTHPLAMGLVLLLQTLVVVMTTGLLTSQFWFSYVLFLVFLGGMLVLFIYMTSLASNEMFTFSAQTLLMAGGAAALLTLTQFVDPFVWSPNFNMAGPSTPYMGPVIDEVPLMLINFYNPPTHLLTLMLILYLLLTLIVVVSVTHISDGPLRPKH